MPENSSALGWVYVVGAVLAFLVGREIVCWYFKLNEIASLLRQVRDRLSSMQAYGIAPFEKPPAQPPAAPQDAVVSVIERALDGLRSAWKQQRGVVIGVSAFVLFLVVLLVGFVRGSGS